MSKAKRLRKKKTEREKPQQEKRQQSQKKPADPTGKLLKKGSFLIGILLILILFKDPIYAKIHELMGIRILKNDYRYHQLSIASQTPVEELLYVPAVEEDRSADEPEEILEQENALYLEMLHLDEVEQDSPVDKATLEIVRKVLDSAYQYETSSSSLFERAKQDVGISDELQNDAETEDYFNSYLNEENSLESLYQAANALFGRLDEGDVKNRTAAAAAVVNWNECYLQDVKAAGKVAFLENIHSESLICFRNGKTCYILAASGELSQYENVLWMMAYGNMEKALETVTEEERIFGLVHYYLGNIGYQLLTRIDGQELFYLEMQEKTKQHLVTAQSCIDDSRYQIEANMEADIQRLLEDGYLNSAS